jgi:hypothetical protein
VCNEIKSFKSTDCGIGEVGREKGPSMQVTGSRNHPKKMSKCEIVHRIFDHFNPSPCRHPNKHMMRQEECTHH